MKILKYIFFSLILLIDNNNVYANSYNVITQNDINLIEKNLNENNTISIYLDYNKDNLTINRKIIDLIKEKNKTIIYNILSNNEIIYSYTFDGKYINKSYNDINLKLNYNSDKDNIINKYFKNNKKIIINTEYKGYYPKGTILSIKNNINIKKAYLYNIDNKNKLNKLNNVNINNNYISININKGNTYIINNKELVNMKTIKAYIAIIIILLIEIIIFIYIAFLKKDIEIPKCKTI